MSQVYLPVDLAWSVHGSRLSCGWASPDEAKITSDILINIDLWGASRMGWAPQECITMGQGRASQRRPPISRSSRIRRTTAVPTEARHGQVVDSG